MTKYVKNLTATTQTWAGQEIQAGTFYTLAATEESRWANDSVVITSIVNGELAVARSTNDVDIISDISLAINYLKDITRTDEDGVPLTRGKITKSGWHFQCQSIEGTTSVLNSLINQDSSGQNLGFSSIRYYNAADVELVAGTQAELDASCVRTEIDWEPTENYEVLGGVIGQTSRPTEDVRIWITAVPDVPAIYGGSIPFCQGGINLKLLSDGVGFEVDGKTPKLMTYDAINHTNKFRVTVRHPAGYKHNLAFILKIFRGNS